MSLYIDIEKKLGGFHLKVKFSAENETLALLGASGCGKSMTLKCIAGIEKPDRGVIVLDGRTLFDSEKKINLTPQERKTGFMFQNYALFPNMTVKQNIFAGASREKDKNLRSKKVTELMESFGLTELASHYPHQLSGGQQQRVSLARILVSGPQILLLDEPFSALDSHLRFRLEQEVKEVIKDFGKTAILVSHDRDEVFRLSDSIAIMDSGKIDTIGPKKAVFSAPQTISGAKLTGCKNISRIKKLDSTHVFALDWGIELSVPPMSDDITAIGIRMHGITAGDGENSFICSVSSEIENPFSHTVMLVPENAEGHTPIGWEMDKAVWAENKSDKIKVSLPQSAILLLRD